MSWCTWTSTPGPGALGLPVQADGQAHKEGHLKSSPGGASEVLVTSQALRNLEPELTCNTLQNTFLQTEPVVNWLRAVPTCSPFGSFCVFPAPILSGTFSEKHRSKGFNTATEGMPKGFPRPAQSLRRELGNMGGGDAGVGDRGEVSAAAQTHCVHTAHTTCPTEASTGF